MVEKIAVPQELEQITTLIKQGRNFLLSGGAGSGKTYSLVEVIRNVLDFDPYAQVACMTYTNAAVKEIEERLTHDHLQVTTIHDFLWDCIKSFQKDIKQSLIELMNDPAAKLKGPEDQIPLDFFDQLQDPIQYKQSTRIKDGIISHDEVIELAVYMFEKYRRLCDILKDRFKYVFIDEYQDTHPEVISLFLSVINKGNKSNVIGLFGDSMQSIYDDGVGDVNAYLASGMIIEVRKTQNRRNPKTVIDLANLLRNDKLIQKPSEDPKAPNMVDGNVKDGSIRFVYSDSNDLVAVKAKIGWGNALGESYKELNLTHNLIAVKADFPGLMEIYDRDPIMAFKTDLVREIKRQGQIGLLSDFAAEDSFDKIAHTFPLTNRSGESKLDILTNTHRDLYDKVKHLPYDTVRKLYIDKDSLIDDKKESEKEENRTGSRRDPLIKHLFKLYHNVNLYQRQQYNEFIRKTQYSVSSVAKKIELKRIIEALSASTTLTIAEVIDQAHQTGICIPDDRFNRFVENNEYLYSRVSKVAFREFVSLYNYLEGYTPFSTQHKIKGREFSNVLVILDNGGWSQYNFEYLLDPGISLTKSKAQSYPRILARTQKLFYVCCTRAMDNLTVFYHQPSPEIIEQAKVWFKGNILKI